MLTPQRKTTKHAYQEGFALCGWTWDEKNFTLGGCVSCKNETVARLLIREGTEKHTPTGADNGRLC
jgi:hypothetical protein